ncbi:Sry-beta [Drosophila busckii]|uniref:Sry-beta n=1 Tax=Drosophila busckii TaxID=30019 RepID=A0A0M5J220_DROBS|nr:Sry-beta [Drosophila busckii]
MNKSVGCIVPGTFKPIKDILKHFEKVINQRLDLQPNSTACRDCLEYLFNYDRLVRNLSQVQRQIADSLINCRKKKPVCVTPKLELVKPKVVVARTPSEKSPKYTTKPVVTIVDAPGPDDDDISACEDLIQEDLGYNIQDDSDDSMESEIVDNIDVPCHICGELFTNQDCLDRHVKMDNCQKNERTTCSVCGIRVKDEEVLDLHMNLHEGKTELECRYCPKKFSHKRNVLRHMEVHWDKKKYQCEKCGERFSLSWLMYNHLMQHDAEENALICEVCHQQFKTKRTYKHHLRRHQTDRPRYPCGECEKSFVDKYTLKVHRRVHFPIEETKTAAETLVEELN